MRVLDSQVLLLTVGWREPTSFAAMTKLVDIKALLPYSQRSHRHVHQDKGSCSQRPRRLPTSQILSNLRHLISHSGELMADEAGSSGNEITNSMIM